MPPNTSAQTVQNWAVSINETPVERWISGGYGDAEALWRASGKLSGIHIVAEGDVSTIDTAGVSRRAKAATRPLLFLRDTPLTEPSEALKALAEDGAQAVQCARFHASAVLGRARGDQIQAGQHDLRDHGVRGAGAWCRRLSGSGACVYCRGAVARHSRALRHRLSARPDRPDDEHDPHAWTEAWVEELGWVAFDSSLGHCPVEGHVSLTVGLDAQDAAPIRAVVSHGGGVQLSSDVQIAALPLDQQAQTQTQQ